MGNRPSRLILFTLALSATAACGKSGGSSTDAADAPETGAGGSPSSGAAPTQAAQQGALAGHDAGAADGPVAGNSGRSAFFAPDALTQRLLLGLGSVTGQASIGGCDVTLAGDSNTTTAGFAVNANLTFDASKCAGKNKVTGTESVQATWAPGADTDSRILKVTDTLTRTLANADTVAISSLDASLGYTYQLTSTGMPASGLVSMQVLLNEQRVRTAADGKVVFHHAITTDANAQLMVENAYSVAHGSASATTRTLVSGTVHVHHLLAHFVASHAMDHVTYDLTGSCACPMSGSMVQTVVADSGAGGYTRTYTFTGCGEATVTTSASTLSGTANGSATVTMDDCTQ